MRWNENIEVQKSILSKTENIKCKVTHKNCTTRNQDKLSLVNGHAVVYRISLSHMY